jgi:hypothetical protein
LKKTERYLTSKILIDLNDLLLTTNDSERKGPAMMEKEKNSDDVDGIHTVYANKPHLNFVSTLVGYEVLLLSVWPLYNEIFLCTIKSFNKNKT